MYLKLVSQHLAQVVQIDDGNVEVVDIDMMVVAMAHT